MNVPLRRSLLPALLSLACAASAADETPAPLAANPHGDSVPDCRLCHGEQSWAVGDRIDDFDHGTTGFPLEGRHADAACRDCHAEPVFAHVGTACADCHRDIHRGRLGFDCAACHTPAAWIDRSAQQREHDATRLPLVGAHARVDCDACHAGAATGDFVGTPAECRACHRDDFEAATEPDHVAAGFGDDCDRCHQPFASTWGRGDFIHDPAFPLTGAHASLACTDCHIDGFAGTSADCVGCHRADYDGAADPDHAAANFPLDCAACHRTTAWSPAEFDHDATGFALTGAHRTLDCAACHDGGFAGTPTDCYACHAADYDATQNPAHASAGFGTDCASCHRTTAWVPSTWDHESRFPIGSGPHTGLSCAECHVVPGNSSVYECILCHEHNRTDTDRDHSEVGDYRYESTACFECHPQGR